MKKVFSLLLVMILGVFVLTGCGKTSNKEKAKKDNTTTISYKLGNGTVEVSVPKDKEGNPKYEFTTEKPQNLSVAKTFYLVTDKSIIGFATSGMSYNTSAKYKAKYGDTKATFDGYLKFIEDKDLFDKSYLPGLKQLKINDRKAIRYYNRSGSSNNYKYFGYFYMVAADDIYPGSKFDMVVNYNEEEKPTEAKAIDKETQEIIKSLKITSNTK